MVVLIGGALALYAWRAPRLRRRPVRAHQPQEPGAQ
jgi:hypothetical protein